HRGLRAGRAAAAAVTGAAAVALAVAAAVALVDVVALAAVTSVRIRVRVGRLAGRARDRRAGGRLDPVEDGVRAHVDAAVAARRRRVVEAARHHAGQHRAVRGGQVDRAARVTEAGVGVAAGDELAARAHRRRAAVAGGAVGVLDLRGALHEGGVVGLALLVGGAVADQGD